MVLNRLTPILVAVHVLTIPTSATNVRASSVLQPYHFPSVPYLHIRPMYMPHLYCSHIIFLPAAKCILTSSAYTILVHITTRSAADAIIGKGERGPLRQKFDHHYSK